MIENEYFPPLQITFVTPLGERVREESLFEAADSLLGKLFSCAL
jgi:hypothetical protein